MRGPGDFFGSRQHGLPEMKIAMLTDTALLNEANRFAREIITDDPDFEKEENKNLREGIAHLFSGEYVMN